MTIGKLKSLPVVLTVFLSLFSPAFLGCVADVSAPAEDRSGSVGQELSPPALIASPGHQSWTERTAVHDTRAPQFDPKASSTPLVVAYNTPGPQKDDAGNLLGTPNNPFTLVMSKLYADATHQNNWAVDATAHYGTFYQGLMLGGVQQYKWIQCGAPGAGC